jgi:hypothetical protein
MRREKVRRYGEIRKAGKKAFTSHGAKGFDLAGRQRVLTIIEIMTADVHELPLTTND